MDAETKHQLYGGEISDYLPQKETKHIKDDMKSISDIYSQQVKSNRLAGLRLNISNNFNNKLK